MKSVKTFETLSEIVKFIERSHTHINSNNGVYALKLLRHPDGTRVPFEEMRGIRIQKFIVDDDNTLIIQQHSHGKTIRWAEDTRSLTYVFDARMFLSNLAMVNVYDYSAEFLTVNSIDFTYIEQTKEASVVMLSEWLNEQPGILRAQWFMDSDIEKVLAIVGLEHKIKRESVAIRNIDLDLNL